MAEESKVAIRLTAVARHFQAYQQDGRHYGLQPLTLDIPKGKITVIVGRSGSGKTTLLRLLAGLERPDEGQIDQVDKTALVRMMFQEPRLLPWKTVRENMTFAALAGTVVTEDESEACLKLLGLTDFAAAYPNTLSGGMAQRVALGRALCAKASILLMDEPFGALDYFTRRQLQQELLTIQAQQNMTMVFVTHDVAEAILLGDSIVCLRHDGQHQIWEAEANVVRRQEASYRLGMEKRILQAISD